MIQLLTTFAATEACDLNATGGSFLGFPRWYKYLEGAKITTPGGTGTECIVRINHLNDVWLIVAAIIELLLRIGALVAIAMVITGGIQYITSEGNSDKAGKALKTLINAVIGLALTVAAAAIVSFVAGRFN